MYENRTNLMINNAGESFKNVHTVKLQYTRHLQINPPRII